jgi:pimeloyl-ACP methyl ester carboxylesterase
MRSPVISTPSPIGCNCPRNENAATARRVLAIGDRIHAWRDRVDSITHSIHPIARRISGSVTMPSVPLPLFVLPGIGADARLFDAQRAVRDIHPIAWIAPEHPRETLTHYAQRLASDIRISEPFDLGGASFGGMVALELARHLAPRRVFLFGSCRSPRSIAPLLRALRFFAPVLPNGMLHPPRVLQSLGARWFGATSRAHVQLFADMLAATPVEFMRWATIATRAWEGVEELPMPIHHIHGDRDRLIPINRVRPDRVIAGAGHLLTVTHVDAVNDFIADVDQ